MATSKYTKDDLSRAHIEAFREIAKQYPPRCCVGTKPWYLRIGNGNVQLVVTVSTRPNEQTKDWSEREITMAL